MRAIQPPFGTLPTIDGYDVILLDTGRPVNHRPTLRAANGVARVMNLAVYRGGPTALTRALGAPDMQHPYVPLANERLGV